jgi:hypothetical protein
MTMPIGLLAIGAFAVLTVAACGRSDPGTAITSVRTTVPAGSAETACVTTVANQTGAGDVSVISVTPSAAGTSVAVAVPGGAPWTCVIDAEGNVQSATPTA